MPRLFFTSIPLPAFACVTCETHVAAATPANVTSCDYSGVSGRALLVAEVILPNLRQQPPRERTLLTGVHVTSDLHCGKCNALIGWRYLAAADPAQAFKVGSSVIERAFLVLLHDVLPAPLVRPRPSLLNLPRATQPLELVRGGGGGGGGGMTMQRGAYVGGAYSQRYQAAFGEQQQMQQQHMQQQQMQQMAYIQQQQMQQQQQQQQQQQAHYAAAQQAQYLEAQQQAQYAAQYEASVVGVGEAAEPMDALAIQAIIEPLLAQGYPQELATQLAITAVLQQQQMQQHQQMQQQQALQQQMQQQQALQQQAQQQQLEAQPVTEAEIQDFFTPLTGGL